MLKWDEWIRFEAEDDITDIPCRKKNNPGLDPFKHLHLDTRLVLKKQDTVDGSEILLASWYGEYPVIYRVLYIPGVFF